MKKKAIHMKFLNHSIGFCLLLTLLCYSCASDYLDTAPTNQVSPADLFKDEAYAAYAVSGLEKLMKTTYPTNKLDGVSFNGEGSVKLMYAEYQGADMYCPRNNFYTIFNGASHAIPTSSYTEYMWHYYYKVISNANAIINYVDPESSHKFKYIYAQALTYRAYCYLQLLQFYSPRWCDSQNGSADGWFSGSIHLLPATALFLLCWPATNRFTTTLTRPSPIIRHPELPAKKTRITKSM